MLSVDALQPPKSGRSRFSKALPAVPGLDDSSPTSTPKDLPNLPPASGRPPRSDSIPNAKSSKSSLPPLPLLKTANAPPSGPPTMAIPRRPVGLPAQPRPVRDPQPASSQQPPSPSDSLSSILSAYSRSSGESLVRTSEAPLSALESEVTISPNDEAILGRTKLEAPAFSSAAVKANEQPHKQTVAPNPITDDIPPPPPSKDSKHDKPTSSVAPQNNKQDLNQSSQPQPQLWRRRSLKAERSRELPDLQLVSSHGSTASTQPVAPTQSQLPPGVLQVTPLSFQPPRTTGGLPGRNIRPTPAEEQTVEAPAMGNNSSKLKNLKDKLQSLHRKGKLSSDTTAESGSRPGAQRPPTPEYQKEDVKTPIIETFVSPVSPAASPELPSEVSPVLSNEANRENSAGATNLNSKPISRKAVPTPTLSPDSARSSPELTAKAHTSGTEPFPSVSIDILGNRTSAGSNSTSSRTNPSTNQSSDAVKFPPRKSSVARPNLPRAPEQPRQLSAELDPRLVQSETQGPLYRGRDGTLYPEMKVLQEPDPQAYYFPKQATEQTTEGAVIKATPLKSSHYNCYHGHKTMNRRMNRNYPLTCQTCDKSDAEDRWACTFCHLRICESCLKLFNGHQRDLRRLVDDLGLRPPSLS